MSARTIQVASRITGLGMAVPERVIPNSHFASYLETTDEWIRERTGIVERRWVEPSTPLSALAEPACREALKQAGLTPEHLDGIICGTVTPDHLFPSAACSIQRRLGMRGGFAFDLNAVCSGFLYAFATADSFLRAGLANHLLVVGADIFSSIIDPEDRTTCVLFGDGAGAVVLSRDVVSGSTTSVRGVYGSALCSDGSLGDLLCVGRGTAVELTPEYLEHRHHFLKMAGREVFRNAVRSIAEVSKEVLTSLGLEIEEVDFVVSHQANRRILEAVGEQLHLPEQKLLMNVHRYGNTSAASVPLLLAESVQQGTVKEGDLLLLNAFGGGLTWGASVVRL